MGGRARSAAALVGVLTLMGGSPAGAADRSAVTAPAVGVDPAADGALLRAWNSLLPDPAGPSMGFTGNLFTDPCQPGGSSAAYRGAQLETLNAARAIAGVGPLVEDPAWTQAAQAAAIIVAADGTTTAVRTGSERCYTTAGANGSVRALQGGFAGPTNLFWYAADDPSAGVPRRRAILCPSLDRVGLGNAPDANAVVVRATATPTQSAGPMRDGFVAWPNPGQVPLLMLDALAPPNSRFSVHLPVGSLTAGAAVTIVATTGAGAPAPPVTALAPSRDDSGECQPTVSFVPSRRPLLGETWTVSVTGLVVNGAARTVGYAHRFTGLTTDTPFVAAAYRDFLGRDPSVPERDLRCAGLWTGAATRAGLLTELSSSDEWLTQIVRRMYLDTLGREPDPAGLSTWVSWIRSGRFTVAQAAALFYSSAEFYLGIGGGTRASWVTALYRTILGREPDPAGLSFWVGYAADPAFGPTWVAGQFYQSLESRLRRVASLYGSLLGRAPDPNGWAYWAEIIGTAGDLRLAVSLAGSLEYDLRAWARF